MRKQKRAVYIHATHNKVIPATTKSRCSSCHLLSLFYRYPLWHSMDPHPPAPLSFPGSTTACPQPSPTRHAYKDATQYHPNSKARQTRIEVLVVNHSCRPDRLPQYYTVQVSVGLEGWFALIMGWWWW